MSGAYYNEIDSSAAQWLRELIKTGHITPGDVDERSIEDVSPDELTGYAQCHFFAGIGVWSHALRRAGWDDTRPVWTGSCPCQPFSSAGKGAGFADERHLWPAFHWLIRQCRPDIVFGEQVAQKAGAAWFDVVQADMEAAGYACGRVVFPACGVGAPHLRQRSYWVADAQGERRGEAGPDRLRQAKRTPERGDASSMADTASSGQPGGRGADGGHGAQTGDDSESGRPGPANGFWRDADWLGCRDGKWRAVEPRTFPLAARAPARMGRLRGYGNGLVAPAAQAFIESYMDI